MKIFRLHPVNAQRLSVRWLSTRRYFVEAGGITLGAYLGFPLEWFWTSWQSNALWWFRRGIHSLTVRILFVTVGVSWGYFE
jgi:hypothetical protein